MSFLLLQQLFEKIEYTGSLPSAEVQSVEMDSRKVKQGSVFVCTKGLKTDSHTLAEEALEKGACLIVSERKLGLEKEVTVENGRKAYALLSAALYDYPAEKLTLIGITGTNGKSTVASIIKQLLDETGYKAGLIGTMYNQIGEMEIPAKYTTPEAGDLHALLARMVQADCTHAVMEASSQALAQYRLYGVHFHTGVFTNLSQDHLDYHKTIDAYFDAKKMLFAQCEQAVINIDDEHGALLAKELTIPLTTFSQHKDEADYTARNLELKANGVQFELVGKSFIKRVKLNMPGEYSCQNGMAAVLAAASTGADIEELCNALEQSGNVRGRCEVVFNKNFTVIRDFAHTADALENLLSSIAPFKEGRLVVLFGCAGERDATKRPAMGQAVCKYADYIVLTQDNPRGEDPYRIFADVEPVLKQSGKPYVTEINRRKAILDTLNMLQDKDTLLLCGKGHEDYQVLKNQTVYLNEKQIVQEWAKEKGL